MFLPTNELLGFRRRKELSKMPINEAAGQVLLAPMGAASGGSCADNSVLGAGSRNGHHQQHPSDPVELRRINFQTPALLSHQPIAVSDLSSHIAYLKDNEGRPFSDVSTKQAQDGVKPSCNFYFK